MGIVFITTIHPVTNWMIDHLYLRIIGHEDSSRLVGSGASLYYYTRNEIHDRQIRVTLERVTNHVSAMLLSIS